MTQEADLFLLQSMIQMQNFIFSCVDRKEFSFTRTQFRIFIILSIEGDLNMKQIAQYICSSQEQTTRAVKPLADAGYVERYINPQNRTRVYIRLTEKGRQLLDQQSNLISDRLSRKLRTSLSAEEIESLYEASSSINRLLSKVK